MRELQREAPGGTAAGKIFYTLEEAKVVIGSWRRHNNTGHQRSLSMRQCWRIDKPELPSHPDHPHGAGHTIRAAEDDGPLAFTFAAHGHIISGSGRKPEKPRAGRRRQEFRDGNLFDAPSQFPRAIPAHCTVPTKISSRFMQGPTEPPQTSQA